MARNQITKIDLMSTIYKWKTSLYDHGKSNLSIEAQTGYHEALNDILEYLKQFGR
jgi:hypothetical protein|tara:strand:+ start:731 stop:895 length:165 start_codon:yes stop_codon:yes gene_type:complete